MESFLFKGLIVFNNYYNLHQANRNGIHSLESQRCNFERSVRLLFLLGGGGAITAAQVFD
jgi:hypothetical protein